VDLSVDMRRHEALPGMADLEVDYRTVAELLRELAVRLHKVTKFRVAAFSWYNPSRDAMHVHIWEGSEILP
jgi:hypothetical protein